MIESQMQRIRRGFTLIELMILIAIVSILAADALPQYRIYVARSPWTENLESVGAVKQAIAECVRNQAGTMPGCDSVAALIRGGYLPAGWVMPTPKFASGAIVITAGTGAIVVMGNSHAGHCVVSLTPVVSADNIVSNWSVTNGGGCTRLQTGVGT